MVYFQTKNPNLGKFWEDLAIKDVGLFYGHLVYFSRFGIFYGYLLKKNLAALVKTAMSLSKNISKILISAPVDKSFERPQIVAGRRLLTVACSKSDLLSARFEAPQAFRRHSAVDRVQSAVDKKS
jgi:hypothetical protein